MTCVHSVSYENAEDGAGPKMYLHKKKCAENRISEILVILGL